MIEKVHIRDIIKKWGFKFKSDTDPILFLEWLNALQEYYGISSPYLLKLLPELFEGTALMWYRKCYLFWSTWEDFLEDFYLQYMAEKRKQPRDRLMFLNIWLCGAEFKALVDTGAAASFVGRQAAEHLKQKGIKLVNAVNDRIKLADSRMALTEGIFIAQADIEQTSVTASWYYIPDLSSQVIIGMDVLIQTRAIIDIKNRKINFSTIKEDSLKNITAEPLSKVSPMPLLTFPEEVDNQPKSNVCEYPTVLLRELHLSPTALTRTISVWSPSITTTKNCSKTLEISPASTHLSSSPFLKFPEKVHCPLEPNMWRCPTELLRELRLPSEGSTRAWSPSITTTEQRSTTLELPSSSTHLSNTSSTQFPKKVHCPLEPNMWRCPTELLKELHLPSAASTNTIPAWSSSITTTEKCSKTLDLPRSPFTPQWSSTSMRELGFLPKFIPKKVARSNSKGFARRRREKRKRPTRKTKITTEGVTFVIFRQNMNLQIHIKKN